MASWERGYGDFVLEPDLQTLRTHPLARRYGARAGRRRVGGRRTGSARRPARCCGGSSIGSPNAGWTAMVGTELEFIVLADTYEEAWSRATASSGPRTSTTPTTRSSRRHGSSRCLRRIRNSMAAAGMVVESAKGECNLGQHEITFRYDEALVTCDNHVVYKNGAKEIAAQERDGGHVHGQAQPARRQLVSHPLELAR